ncbi:GGDEF domain-containing protein [Amycolatopsis arida]|uniref:GGDEF domain-containing protein n=1 Tax=Amycolatopsis arida TaxID=587909 RepID=UPI001416FE5C|nr:GGDEF domain-containing protein [Amycolatopsis arida]
MLLIDLAGIAAGTLGVLVSPAPSHRHWLLFALFTAVALAHMAATRPAEERRRAARLDRGKVEFVDQTSMWFGAAALVLPTTLATALVLVVRTHRYFIARKPPGLWISTTATIVLAVVGVGVTRDLLGGAAWLTATPPADSAGGAHAVLVMLAAVVVYFLAEAVPIGVYRGLRWGRWRLADTIGTWEDNKLLGHTLLLAMATALVAAVAPLGLLGMLAVAVRETRTVGRITALEVERERLRIDALTDPLTGLPNRRGFTPLATAAVEVDRASGRPTSMLMLDLDHFKGWNTRLGHPGADRVLQAVASVLRRQTRHGDLLARMGGEEMAVLLPGTGAGAATEVAERIRRAVESLDTEITKPAGGAPVRLGRHGVPACTASIGVATAPPSAPRASALAALERLSDSALELAKRRGRNQVVAVRTPSAGSAPREQAAPPGPPGR